MFWSFWRYGSSVLPAYPGGYDRHGTFGAEWRYGAKRSCWIWRYWTYGTNGTYWTARARGKQWTDGS